MANEITPSGNHKPAEPLITAAALSGLYGATSTIIVEAGLLKLVQKFLPASNLTIVKLSPDGVLSLLNEVVQQGNGLSPLLGVPIGVKAVICGKKTAPAIQKLLETFDKAQLFTTPQVLEITSKRRSMVMAGLLEIFAKANDAELERFGALTKELAVLRQEHEKALHQVEKANRLMDVLGYSHASLTYEAPVDKAALFDVPSEGVYQHLPVDLAALMGIELYASDIDPASSAMLRLCIKRVADGKLVWESERAAKQFNEGWNFFDIVVTPDLYGEASLSIEWLSDDKGLRFALSNVDADRFGLSYGQKQTPDNSDVLKQTLAFKIWQGPALPPRAETDYRTQGTLSSSDEATRTEDISKYERSLKISKFSELVSRTEFLHGSEAHVAQFNEHGFWPLMMSEDLAYMQTHPLLDMTSAVIMKQGAPSDMTRIGVQVRSAHEAAVPFRYILMRLPAEIDDKPAAVESVIADISDSNLDGVTYHHEATGIIWGAKILPAETQGMIELSLDKPLGTVGDLVFAVLPATDSIAFGWCRWYSLYIETSRGC